MVLLVEIFDPKDGQRAEAQKSGDTKKDDEAATKIEDKAGEKKNEATEKVE